jgi:hypothetical protein
LPRQFQPERDLVGENKIGISPVESDYQMIWS